MTMPYLGQIQGRLGCQLKISNFASGTGTSVVVTTPITTLLATAGQGGVSVPLQVAGASPGQGVITSASLNRSSINLSTSGDLIENTNNLVYGRITEAAGVYTLSYFYRDSAGVETAHTMGTSVNIDFTFNYYFSLGTLPDDALLRSSSLVFSDDPTNAGSRRVVEKPNVTALNTIADLTFTPISQANIELFVNGICQSSLNTDFTCPSKTITWSTASAGFAIPTTYAVIAAYNTNE